MEHSNNFNGAVHGVSPEKRKRLLNTAIDRLFTNLFFASEAESIQPENVEKTKQSFFEFLDEMNFPLAEVCFEELLREKTGEFAFRADGKVPNWYHEIRQCLYTLSLVRSGLLQERHLLRHGGLEVALSITLRHDSWEDLGKDRMAVYIPLERKLHQLQGQGLITEDQLYVERSNSVKIVDGMDLLTRKIPEINEWGNYVRKDNGKIKKNDRFNGQLMLYYNRILQSPLTALGKFGDGIEGMSTRVGVQSYTVEDDRKYTAERRMLYGRRPLDIETMERYPFLKPAIRAADGMLGILLVGVETLNDYSRDGGQNPKFATPIRIDSYAPAARKGFQYLPPAWHPIFIFMERMRDKSLRDGDNHIDLLNKNALLPPLGTYFPSINIYKAPFLPEASRSALTF